MRLLLLPLLALAIAASGAVAARPPTSLDLVEKGLARAEADGRLTAEEAAGYRATARAADAAVRSLPPTQSLALAGQLGDVASLWQRYSAPRALTLFTMLAENLRFLRTIPLGAREDLYGLDGVVYRLEPGHGYAFHPLANAARLNQLALRGDDVRTEQLAFALAARGVPAGGGLVWEYPFPFGAGRPGWASGMAQAVMAQALARAASLLSNEELLSVAERAFRAVGPGFVFPTGGGPWIRLYDWSRLTVLNAQLQATISLSDYADLTGDDDAATLAARLQEAAAALLPRFDTGAWSRYALDGRESPLGYHEYVIDLLLALARRTGDPSWRDRAERFQRYEQEPPVVKAGPGGPVLYPVPRDGYRDVARLRFWISKISRVTLRIGGRVYVTALGRGQHTLVWNAVGHVAGTYHPTVTAVGPRGLRASVALPPVVVRHAWTAPTVIAEVVGRRTVRWESPDEWTPWLELSVRLRQGSVTRVLDLGRRGRNGHATLRLPDGRWQATLLAEASSGRTRAIPLGSLPRLP